MFSAYSAVFHSGRVILAAAAILMLSGDAPSRADESPIAPLDVPPSNAATEFVPKLTAAEQRAVAALKAPVTVTFTKTPVADALRKLGEQTGVKVQLQADLEAGYAEHTLDGEFENVPLELVLQQTLRSVLEPEGIAITPCPTASGVIVSYRIGDATGASLLEQVTRVYPVGDLCPTGDDADQLVELLKSSTGGYWKSKSPDGVPGVMYNGLLWTVQDDDDVYEMGAYAGSITYLRGVNGLVVKADRAAHLEILELVRMLRQAQRVSAGRNTQRHAAASDTTPPVLR